MEVKTAFLSLGSNLGDKIEILSRALGLINLKCGEVSKTSSVIETDALGFESNDIFNNCCVEIKTLLTPEQLLRKNQEIEKEIGRVKFKKDEYESRIIDIDIILYENDIITTKELTVPHLHYKKRNFVLYPLDEIAAKKIDPINQLTISQIKQNSPDLSIIKRLKAII